MAGLGVPIFRVFTVQADSKYLKHFTTPRKDFFLQLSPDIKHMYRKTNSKYPKENCDFFPH